MKEPTRFLGIESRAGKPVAILSPGSFSERSIVLNLPSARLRLRNLKAGGWPHDETEQAVAALEAQAHD